jgi:hypothetical protein
MKKRRVPDTQATLPQKLTIFISWTGRTYACLQQFLTWVVFIQSVVLGFPLSITRLIRSYTDRWALAVVYRADGRAS